MKKAELVNEVIELQRLVRQALRQYVPDAWMESDLTVGQLRTLSIIATERSINTKRLAEELGVTSSNMTGIVDRLVKQGFVTRQENPEDRRMLQIRITPSGEAMLTDLREKTRKSMSLVLTRMSPEELSALATGLSAMIKAAESQ